MACLHSFQDRGNNKSTRLPLGSYDPMYRYHNVVRLDGWLATASHGLDRPGNPLDLGLAKNWRKDPGGSIFLEEKSRLLILRRETKKRARRPLYFNFHAS